MFSLYSCIPIDNNIGNIGVLRAVQNKHLYRHSAPGDEGGRRGGYNRRCYKSGKKRM